MRKRLSLILSLLCISSCPAPGATWYVDDSVPASGDGLSWETAFPAIQEAIDAAFDGDKVFVAPGTYLENAHFHGKSIILRSTNPFDPGVVVATIIDGNNAGPVVTFSGSEDRTCVLEGFTLQNGFASNGGGVCGGTRDQLTRARIQYNTITKNKAGYGGAIAWCGGRIQINTITANSAVYYGGGLWECLGTIQNNQITGNSAGDDGGGLHNCDGTIRRNTIRGNSAGWFGGGLAGCDHLIRNNVIIANSAEWRGGGLWECRAIIENNLVAGNYAGSDGGGFYDCDKIVESNTIADNSAGSYGGGTSSCNGTIRNCIIWGNTAPNNPEIDHSSDPTYSCVRDWSGGGEGNITEDPAFLDRDGPDDDPLTYDDNDYRLSSDSACVDKGKNEDWMQHAVDLDGKTRIFDGGVSFTVDIGSYEVGPWTFGIFEVIMGEIGEPEVTWRGWPGDTYTVWSCLNLPFEGWVQEATVPSQGTTTTWSDPDAALLGKFYRVERK